MSTSVILLFFIVFFLVTIHWWVKLFTGRKEEAFAEILFLLVGLVALWFVGGVIAFGSVSLELIFQTWFAQLELSQAQTQLLQGAALVVAAVLILNVEKIWPRFEGFFSKICSGIRALIRKN